MATTIQSALQALKNNDWEVGDLPLDINDVLWKEIKAELGLNLKEIAALKNHCSTLRLAGAPAQNELKVSSNVTWTGGADKGVTLTSTSTTSVDIGADPLEKTISVTALVIPYGVSNTVRY